MATGFRGLLAPWIGGAANNPTPTNIGYRSLLAPWMGGAGYGGGAPVVRIYEWLIRARRRGRR